MMCKNLARTGLLFLLALGGACCMAQQSRNSASSQYAYTGNAEDNPDWAEEPVPPAPTFVKDHLIRLEMPDFIANKVSVDPDTLVVGGDGVVRYVMVMVNASGNTAAVYEGIRCATGEVKTYARLSSSGKWNDVAAPVWKPLNDNLPSRHAFAFARQGACVNRVATSKQEIVGILKSGRLPSQANKLN